MPHPCVVCGRSRMNPNNRTEEYNFFGFPVNDEPRCKKWLEFCCREELYKLTKKKLLQRMICSKHFLRSDFVNEFYDRLNSTAVPTIYDPKQSLYFIGCVLCGRFRKDPPGEDNDGATFHHFPGEEFRCLDWLNFVGVDSYYRLTRKEIMFCYICSKHFDTSQFIPGFKNRLVDTALPNIKFPDENQREDNKSSHCSHHNSDVELFNDSLKDDEELDLSIAVLEGQACVECGRLRSDPRNKTEKYKFHPFPAYEIGRCLKWCQFLGREDILKMSPNQLRKLVLCSAHFQAGQTFNASNQPCDAIPTIKKDNIIPNSFSAEQSTNETVGSCEEGDKFVRASVSSKKPKIDPQKKITPLAKKRGKSRRPTVINIPKVVPKPEYTIISKLPIPTTNSWKLLNNQFQPLSIPSVVNNVTPHGKVVLPLSGNIASLGAPIPVNSLSSVPPGILIKINLPEQDQNAVNMPKKKSRKKSSRNSNKTTNSAQQVINVPEFCNSIVNDESYRSVVIVDEITNNTETITGDLDMHETITDDLDMHENVSYLDNFEDIDSNLEVDNDNSDNYIVKSEHTVVDKVKARSKMSARCRRTLMPIQRELHRFVNNLRPHFQRLPKKSKAHVKLAIVNMVIDRLY